MSTGDEAIERLTSLPLFPFTGTMSMKPLSPRMNAEFPRNGEDGRPCNSCTRTDNVLWRSDRWKITAANRSINPVGLFLETVEHMDFDGLTASLAEEFGRLSWRLEAAMQAQDDVGRVHFHRWGDGAAHFHVWFQGRPARQLELYGWGNVLWSQLVEPLPQAVIDSNHAQVIERFATLAGGFANPA